MKLTTQLAAVALVALAATASAQTQDDVCEANYAANATVIAQAQAAATKVERLRILRAAINANPANAACLADMALQMNVHVEPDAGEFGGETPTTTDGITPPAENPNQLNEGSDTGSASPVEPVLVESVNTENLDK